MIKNIKIIGNILRYIDGFSFDQRWLENILIPTIQAAVYTKIDIMDKAILKEVYDTIYVEYGITSIQKDSWCKIYTKEPTDTVLQIIKKNFADSLVIAFEIHPIMQKAFDKLKIKYIKLMNHPVRYLDDIFFGICSNDSSIYEKLLKYQTNEFVFKQQAGILKGEAAVSEFCHKFTIQPNSCVYFAQTNIDCSLLNKDKILSFFDFKDEFLEDIKPYNHVYFKIHPCETNGTVIDFIKSLPQVSILYPNDINFYDLISSDNIKKCFSISSGALYEARLFGKEVKYYYKQPFMFVSDYSNNKYSIADTFVPIYKTFWLPSFWSDVLSDYFTVQKNIPTIHENYSNKLRRILKLTWGYNDNDSVEFYYNKLYNAREIHNLWGKINKVSCYTIKHTWGYFLEQVKTCFIFDHIKKTQKRKEFLERKNKCL